MAAWREAGYPIEPRGLEDPPVQEGPCPACGCLADDHAGVRTEVVAPI